MSTYTLLNAYPDTNNTLHTLSGSSDKILVNSHFTQRQFQKSFPRLRRIPRVVYPGVDVTIYDFDRVKRAANALGELGVAFSVQNGIRNLCLNP